MPLGRRRAGRDQHAPGRRRGRLILEHSGRAHAARRPRARAAARAARPGRSTWSHRRHGRARTTPTSELLASALARATRELARATRTSRSRSTTPRARPAPEGRGLHAPRRLPERARRGASSRASTPETVYLWTLPMFHCNGWCFPWAVTAVAARARLPARRSTPAAIWRLIDEEGVTHFNGAPTVLSALVEPPGRAPRRAPAHGARRPRAPPSPTLLARMEALDFRVVHVYGLTETYGPTPSASGSAAGTTLDAAGRARLLARQGLAYRDRRPRPRGRRRDARRAARRRDDGRGRDARQQRDGGLLRRPGGDGARRSAAAGSTPATSAVWHPDGTIELRDRAKDIIISGGENISTIEVEQALVRHPAVLECRRGRDPARALGRAAEGVRHAARREPPRPAEELIAHCRERLAHYKAPDAVEFGPLPKTSTGKVQKYVLREREWAGPRGAHQLR